MNEPQKEDFHWGEGSQTIDPGLKQSIVHLNQNNKILTEFACWRKTENSSNNVKDVGVLHSCKTVGSSLQTPGLVVRLPVTPIPIHTEPRNLDTSRRLPVLFVL